MSHQQKGGQILMVETRVVKKPIHFKVRFGGITGLNETIASPDVSAEGFKWKLALVPEKNKEFNCQVSVQSPNNVAVKATCTITLINRRNGRNLSCTSAGPSVARRHNNGHNNGSLIIYENNNFLKSSHLVSSGEFCVNDSIIFVVDITLFTNQEKRIIENQSSSICYSPSSTLLNDLKSFAFNETMSDVRIIATANQILDSKEERKKGKTKEIQESFRSFPAHSFILGLRSSVFRAMLECPMRESETRQIAMHDVREDVMECFLAYLYTDELPSLWKQKYATMKEANQTIETLLELACKYDVSGLKILCEKELEPTINCTNVLTLLMLADKCGAKHLKFSALNFISDNANKVFRNTCMLHALSKELAYEVIQAMSGNDNNEGYDDDDDDDDDVDDDDDDDDDVSDEDDDED